MPIISKRWEAQVWIEGSGTPAWTTLSGTTEEYSAAVDLETNGYEGAHVTVEVDFDASPTDHVKVKVYGSLDGTNWDDTPMYEFTIDKGTDPNQVSFPVRDVAHFRLGFQQTGSTDSHNVRAAYQPWRWQSA
jgi:hypothetical protein